jgi:hypothetical protein
MTEPSHLSTTVAVVADEKPVEAPLVATTVSGQQVVVAESATPTQVANPGRTVLRSILQLLVPLAIATPQIIAIVLDAWSPEWLVSVLVQVLAIYTIIVRVMALPGVEAALQRVLPGLAALRTRQAALE